MGEQHSDKEDDGKFMMYTHKDLVIKYNNDQVQFCVLDEPPGCGVHLGFNCSCMAHIEVCLTKLLGGIDRSFK